MAEYTLHPKFLRFLKDAPGTFFTIKGTSMTPALRDGETVVLEQGYAGLGDIVLFPLGEALFAHRVGLAWNGRLVTIGDNAACPDIAIRRDDVIGIVRGRRSIFRGGLAAMRIAAARSRSVLKNLFAR